MFEIGAERQHAHRVLVLKTRSSLLLSSLLLLPLSGRAAPSPEAIEFFEAKIRPVLAQDCYECHRTGGKQKAGLALDHRAALLAGGDSGPAIKPGDPDGSLLMMVIRHQKEGLKMPKAGAKLEDEIIADFAKWIEMGAPDPREEPSSDQEVAKDTDWGAVMERRKSWWSFQPIKKPALPAGKAAHPVDRFIDRGIGKAGLERAEEADRRSLIRRLSFALRGLPPTSAESEAFAKDTSADAYEKLVDRYLASSQYGERWARHWMDWLRYADSHGSEGDPNIPNSWQYRDYLIRALNADIPYHQLVREHVAGDLLEKPRVKEGRNESAIGPAHLRMVFHGFAPTDALDEKVRFTDDQIASLTKGFLGLTVSCARCHDHKFDAISQKDYYALFGIFGSTKPGMVTATAPGDEGKKRRARMAELKEQIRTRLADHWIKEADAVTKRLAEPAASEKGGDFKHVLHPLHMVAKNEGEFGKAMASWENHAKELKAHRERKYRHDWNVGAGETTGTTHGPTAGSPEVAGGFTVGGGDDAIGSIYPAGAYSHLTTKKDPGVALSPRSLLDGKHEVWARVIGDGAHIRYSVQNYPRNGTVYPTGRVQGGNWKWQRWGVDYWEGDHIHLEVTTGPDQAILVNNNNNTWFGLREVLIVKRGEPSPPGELLDYMEPLLNTLREVSATDLGGVSSAYGVAIKMAAKAWKEGKASDGQAMLLNELLAAGVLSRKSDQTEGLAALANEFRDLESQIQAPTRVPGVWEADSFDQPLFDRGNHKKPLAAVPRRFLEAIDAKPYQSKGSGRRELADDMVRADNPFTTRVIVNRLWHHLFGRGIVSTTDNFGRLGQKPSHPELLDYLASKFVDDGWSMKKAVRFMVTSEAWKRSSDTSEKASEVDPSNILLSHFRVRRLEAEAIRDSLLFVTGGLEDTMYGGPVGGGTPRRSVYVRVRRNSLDSFLAAFDAPTPVSTVGRRDVTNVPAQSLTMLNSDFVIGLAEKWSGQIEGQPITRISTMFEAALGRPPSASELKAAETFVAQMVARRSATDAERNVIQKQLEEGRVKLAELSAEARERVLAIRGVGDAEKTAVDPPIARWDFEGNGEDRIGRMHLKLHQGASIKDGALKVGGGGYALSGPLRQPLRAKTLEAWVQLDNLEQKGGGVMTLQTRDAKDFDSIVYAELKPRRWLAGSERHDRTQPLNGPKENEAHQGAIHIAYTYAADGTVTAYRQGVPYGKPIKPGLKSFAAGNANVIFGSRHGPPSGDRQLAGRILEARLYDRALTAAEIAASASKDQNFVSEKDLVEALSPAERLERESLIDQQKQLAKRLESSTKPGRPSNEWADFAHALFNLKEFIYLR